MAHLSVSNKAVTNNIVAFASLKRKLCADLVRSEHVLMKFASAGSTTFNVPPLLTAENETIRTKLYHVEQILLVLREGWINGDIIPSHELERLEARLSPLLSDGDKWVIEEFYWIENIIDPEDLDSDIFREWLRYIDRLIQKLLAAIYIFRRLDFLQYWVCFIWYFFKEMDDNSGVDAFVLLLNEQPSDNYLNYRQNEKKIRFSKAYNTFA